MKQGLLFLSATLVISLAAQESDTLANQMDDKVNKTSNKQDSVDKTFQVVPLISE